MRRGGRGRRERAGEAADLVSCEVDLDATARAGLITMDKLFGKLASHRPLESFVTKRSCFSMHTTRERR